MLVRPDNAGDLATSDAFVRHSDPHVVARQHDLRQLGGFQSHLNSHGHGHSHGHGRGFNKSQLGGSQSHLNGPIGDGSPLDSPACSCSSQNISARDLCLSQADSGSLCTTCLDIFPTFTALCRKQMKNVHLQNSI